MVQMNKEQQKFIELFIKLDNKIELLTKSIYKMDFSLYEEEYAEKIDKRGIDKLESRKEIEKLKDERKKVITEISELFNTKYKNYPGYSSLNKEVVMGLKKIGEIEDILISNKIDNEELLKVKKLAYEMVGLEENAIDLLLKYDDIH